MPCIQERDSLLSDLARLLMFKPEWANCKLSGIKVTLYNKSGKVVGTFLGAQVCLHYLVEDIYRDDREDWSDAVKLTLETY